MKVGLLSIVILLFAVGTAIAVPVTKPCLDPALKTIPQPEDKFQEVVDVFLAAVDRGELVIFDKKITRSMLDPVEVKYVYKYDGADPAISIFSLLTTSLEIPGVPECAAGGIEALLAIDGTIIDSTVHVPGN